MSDEQKNRRHDNDPRQAENRLGPQRQNERRNGVGDLTAHQNRRYARADLHHGERHDEGRDADARDSERGKEAKRAARH